jgi:pimeloyl-ACP methyl ester carboxylesterase
LRPLVLAALLFAATADCQAAQELVTVPTRSGVTDTYLLIRNPPSATPKVVVIAFVGGFGAIDLATLGSKGMPLKFGPTTNFLIRVRNDLVDADFAEAVVDAPSDKLPQGVNDDFRLGADHLTDIRAVVADVKKRFPDAKVFLVGTSRGTISAAALGAKLGDAVQGTILTTTVTNRDKQGPGLSTFNFASIKIPVLLVHHRDDGCPMSPYYNAERLSKSFPLVSVSGGDPPQSGPCDPQSPHGFFGKDAPVAQAMKSWMLGREFAREIR